MEMMTIGQCYKQFGVPKNSLYDWASKGHLNHSFTPDGVKLIHIDAKFEDKIKLYQHARNTRQDKQKKKAMSKFGLIESKTHELALPKDLIVEKDIKIEDLLDAVKTGCKEFAAESAQWAKLVMSIAEHELKKQANNKINPQEYYLVVKELLESPQVTPIPVGGYSGDKV